MLKCGMVLGWDQGSLTVWGFYFVIGSSLPSRPLRRVRAGPPGRAPPPPPSPWGRRRPPQGRADGAIYMWHNPVILGHPR